MMMDMANGKFIWAAHHAWLGKEDTVIDGKPSR